MRTPSMLVAAQGLWVRKTMQLLPAAGGEPFGQVGQAAEGEQLRLAVVGESTAAGCGVEVHQAGFAAAMATQLRARSRRTVSWAAIGQPGATGRTIRRWLVPQLEGRYDVVVLLAGANDVLRRREPDEWRGDLEGILDLLDDRADVVLVAGTPPFASFPTLPRALRTFLAEGGRALDAVSREVCATRARVTWVSSAETIDVGRAFFGPDNFHPSAHGYRRWAEVVAEAYETP